MPKQHLTHARIKKSVCLLQEVRIGINGITGSIVPGCAHGVSGAYAVFAALSPAWLYQKITQSFR
jgi:hypothetical protein